MSSWSFGQSGTSNHGNTPNGVTWNNYVFTVNPGCQLGVYQKLSTRAFGEIIGATDF